MADQNFPGIPAVSGLVPREIAAVLRPMRETLQMFVGGTLPQQGIINGVSRLRRSDLGNSTAFGGGGGPGVDIDYTPPPAPMNLSAAGAIANVILAWDAVPPAAAARVAYTEIYRSQTNDISTATLIGTSQARVYVDNIGAGGTRYYWIRYVSPAPATPPIRGPYNSQTGTAGTTGYDAGYLIDVLSANPPAGSNYSPLFYVQQIATTIGGVPIPAGVYMNMAIIRNLSVTNAMIANLAVDNAKIANLDAAKINAGYIDAARVLVGSLDAKIATIQTAQIADAGITRAKIANLAVDLANINTASIGSLSALSATIGTFQSAGFGARTVITDAQVSVYDTNGTRRVLLGRLY